MNSNYDHCASYFLKFFDSYIVLFFAAIFGIPLHSYTPLFM